MNSQIFRFIMRTYGRQWQVWAGLIIEAIRACILRVYLVYLTAQIVANLAAGDTEAAMQNTIIMLIVNLVGIGIGLLSDLPAVKAENNVYHGLSTAFHKALTSKDMEFYRNHQSGYLVSLFRQHLDGVMELVRLVRLEMVRLAVSLIVPAVVLFTINWLLGMIAIGIVLLQLGYIRWASGRIHAYRQRAHEVYRRHTGEVADEITNIVAFKASGEHASSHDKISALRAEERDNFWFRRRNFALLDLPRTTLTAVGIAAAVMVVIQMAATTHSTSIVAIATMTAMYLFQISRLTGELPVLIMRYDDIVTKIAPTLAYLSEDDQTIKDTAHPVELTIRGGAISFDNVTFVYDTKKRRQIKVFDEFSLDIKPGEHIGVVGASGAGKSTLVSLLMRFDEVTGGSVKIDGIDIREVRQDELRSQIAYVPQEPLLLHRTVRENILFSTHGKSEEQMIKAAKTAHIHEFITSLPEGYDTVVGERGVKLSGGQKQRVVIARAILKNAPITIFDEATSALDSLSETAIQEAMPKVMGKRTAIVVAHRLSTVARLDRIIVLEKGKIAEQGTHRELLERKGKYYALWQRQSQHHTGDFDA